MAGIFATIPGGLAWVWTLGKSRFTSVASLDRLAANSLGAGYQAASGLRRPAGLHSWEEGCDGP